MPRSVSVPLCGTETKYNISPLEEPNFLVNKKVSKNDAKAPMSLMSMIGFSG